MIIADTCLITHLFNQTDLTNIAQKILDKDALWIVPRLWREEYANVLSKLARRERRPSEEVLQHFSATVEEFKNSEREVDSREALRISIEYKISVYDAHFVALAIDLSTLVISEDIEILKKCPELSVSMKNFLSLQSG